MKILTTIEQQDDAPFFWGGDYQMSTKERNEELQRLIEETEDDIRTLGSIPIDRYIAQILNNILERQAYSLKALVVPIISGGTSIRVTQEQAVKSMRKAAGDRFVSEVTIPNGAIQLTISESPACDVCGTEMQFFEDTAHKGCWCPKCSADQTITKPL